MPGKVPMTAPGKGRDRRRFARLWVTTGLLALIIGLPALAPADHDAGRVSATTLRTPSRSTTLALTRNDRRLVVVNQETDTVSVIEVRNESGADVARKLAEIPVGIEPRCVAL